MGQLLQYVLFAAFVVSSNSYGISRNRWVSPRDRELPTAFQGPQYAGYAGYNNIEYPADYIQKLVDALSHEELEKFKMNQTKVVDRDGELCPNYCSSQEYNFFPTMLPAADISRTWYFVINTEEIPYNYTIQYCNANNNYRCYENATDQHIVGRSNKGCCFPREETYEMPVLSVAIEDWEINKNRGEIVMKKLNIKTKCCCSGISYIKGQDDSGICSMNPQPYYDE